MSGTDTRRMLSVLYAGVFLAALDTAIVAPALPALRAAFGVDHRAAALVTVVYVLASMPSTALMAALSDRHGRRPVFLASVALFALGSLVIALAPGFGTLLAGRVVQGIGGGGILPTASAAIADALPAERRGRALGMVGAVYGMAFVLGPPLAAGVMWVASWPWVFLINLPVAALVLWFGARSLPAPRAPTARPALDRAGIVLVVAMLGALVLGITRVADGWVGATVWPALLAASAALLAVLVAVERRAAQPMIPVGLFANRQLALAYVLTLGGGIGMGAVVFLTSLATLAHGIERAHGGFALLPLVGASMVGSMGSGRMLHGQGARRIVVAGFALLALGYAGVASGAGGLVGFLLASVPAGLGVGVVAGGALRSVAIDEAPLAQRGAAQGLINICTGVGTLLAVSAIGAVADLVGGGAAGLQAAYAGVAATLAALALVALALRRSSRTAVARAPAR